MAPRNQLYLTSQVLLRLSRIVESTKEFAVTLSVLSLVGAWK